MVPTLASSCADAVACDGAARNARWAIASTCSAARISATRDSAADWVRSTSYDRVFVRPVGAGLRSMATTRRIRSSSSKRRIRLLPRKPAEPVTATTPVLAPTEASSRERPIPGERSRGPAFRPERVRLRPLLGRSEADHLTTMLSWRSDDDLQHPGAVAPGAL